MLKGYISIPGAPYVTMFSGGVFADQAIAGQASPGAVTSKIIEIVCLVSIVVS